MRLNTLRFRGLTRFTDTVEIPFADLPGGLVALVGGNGEGKTTIMEAIPAALFRSLPSRDGALPNHCQGRDAFVELEFEFGGSPYRSLVKVDAQAGTQEAHLYNSDGKTALVSGKVKEFDAAIADRITAQSIFLASVFASQTRKGNFLELSKSDRKDLMIRMLGLEHLQKLSDAAGDRAKALDQEIGILRGQLSSLEAQLAGVDVIQAEMAKDEAALADTNGQLATLRVNLQSITEKEANLKANLQRRADLDKTLAELQQEIAKLESRQQDHEERRRNNGGLLDQADAIRNAAAVLPHRLDALDKEKAQLKKADEAREYLIERQGEAQALLDGAATCDRKLAELQLASQKARSEELANKDAEIREAERDVSTCKQSIATSESKVAFYKSEIARMQEQARILGDIPCGDSFPTCSLISNAIRARDSVSDNQDLLREWEDGLAAAKTDLAKDQERLDRLQKERETIASAPVEETTQEIAVRTKAEKYRKDAAEHAPTEMELAAARKAIADCQTKIQDLEAAIKETKKQADLLPKLDAAETRIRELTEELKEIAGAYSSKMIRLDELKKEIAVLPTAAKHQEIATAKARAETDIRTTESTAQVLQGKVAAARARIEDLQKLDAQRTEQQAALDVKLDELSQWRLIQKGMGRDGVQALEIDAAGPEVSALINELLCSCFGPRFTLSFETTAQKADGKGEKEVFDIRILDNERGREGKLETLSGGEKVILNEAISLALAIYNTRKSGKRWETLFRDETAGALDPQNAERYLRMLRRAIELGGFHQLVFIAHQVELWEAADARIFVRGGKAEVA